MLDLVSARGRIASLPEADPGGDEVTEAVEWWLLLGNAAAELAASVPKAPQIILECVEDRTTQVQSGSPFEGVQPGV